ncbi:MULTISPECIES: hypothetical protein [Paenibacillus]|uniref:DUF948 domain-containing protein n=1 Tax=Paenibacillus campinasensis TaxID=66347 RepID=A0A268F0H8_9BACL|nr:MULTISPECIES: hypothetical protein [Paenibacillus]MUG65595.1 DUF948 domain-containing protein [Paenibacillus campinasensis]PAD78879.1 hypothetical protein CHH67_05345 [Paenibacillus campinasensis]PAK53855.1 hypothetical protein CHH75_08530 [Paenibacillus sp. 7541]
MAEWSALAAGIGIMLMAAAAVVMAVSFRKVLQRTEAVLSRLEADSAHLSEEASQVLEQANAALTSVQHQLAAGEAFASSMSEAAAAVAETAENIRAIGKRASVSAIEHIERARLDNERHIGEIFRWIDAGVTVWHSWNRHASKSDEGQAK